LLLLLALIIMAKWLGRDLNSPAVSPDLLVNPFLRMVFFSFFPIFFRPRLNRSFHDPFNDRPHLKLSTIPFFFFPSPEAFFIQFPTKGLLLPAGSQLAVIASVVVASQGPDRVFLPLGFFPKVSLYYCSVRPSFPFFEWDLLLSDRSTRGRPRLTRVIFPSSALTMVIEIWPFPIFPNRPFVSPQILPFLPVLYPFSPRYVSRLLF